MQSWRTWLARGPIFVQIAHTTLPFAEAAMVIGLITQVAGVTLIVPPQTFFTLGLYLVLLTVVAELEQIAERLYAQNGER